MILVYIMLNISWVLHVLKFPWTFQTTLQLQCTNLHSAIALNKGVFTFLFLSFEHDTAWWLNMNTQYGLLWAIPSMKMCCQEFFKQRLFLVFTNSNQTLLSNSNVYEFFSNAYIKYLSGIFEPNTFEIAAFGKLTGIHLISSESWWECAIYFSESVAYHFQIYQTLLY